MSDQERLKRAAAEFKAALERIQAKYGVSVQAVINREQIVRGGEAREEQWPAINISLIADWQPPSKD